MKSTHSFTLKLTRIAMLIMLMIGSIAQSFSASHRVCDTQHHFDGDSQQKLHREMSMQHHDMMSESTDEVLQSQIMQDCCDSECACPATACSSSSAIVNSHDVFSKTLVVNEIFATVTAHTRSVSSSLFRPPIFA